MNETDEQIVRAYRVCFGSPAGRTVLLDLMAFCKFRTPTADQFEEGQRRVFLRIMQFISLEMEQLIALYGGTLPPEAQEEGSEDG